MGDMGDMFQALDEERKARNAARLDHAMASDLDGWTKHTPYHWSRMLAGQKLDWWPSTGKWGYGFRSNRQIIHHGNQAKLMAFIREKTAETPKVQARPAPDNIEPPF